MNFWSTAAVRRLHCTLAALLSAAFAIAITCLPRDSWAQTGTRPLPEAPTPGDSVEENVPESDIQSATSSSARPPSPDTVTTQVIVPGKLPLLINSPRTPSGASQVLTQDRLSRAGDSAADVLRAVAGLQISRTGSKAEPATASIRGTDAKQTPVYLAGVRLNDDVNGSADLSTIPLWMMQRAEVFRGNAPAASEQLGIGGAIFFEPRRPRTTRLGLETHVGSFGERGASVGAEVGGERASALVSLRTSRADNRYWFNNDHGLRFSASETREQRRNADYHDVDGWAVGSVNASNARIGTIVHVLDREQGTTGIATTPALLARTRHRRFLVAVHGTFGCADTWSCTVQTQSSLLVGLETVTDPVNELRTVRSAWHHTSALRHAHSLSVAFEVGPAVTLTPYLHATGDKLELNSLNEDPRRASRVTVRSGVEASYAAASNLDLHAMLASTCDGTQAEYRNIGRLTNEQQTRCPTSPDARVGLHWRVRDELSLLANVSHTTRQPMLGELYGVSAALQGEPELRAEKGYSADAGLRGRFSWDSVEVAADAFVFRRWTSNLVRYRQTSLHAFSPYNVGEAEVTGAEVSLATRTWGELETYHSLTLLEPRETTRDRVANSTRNDILPLTSRLVTHHTLTWSKAFDDSAFRGFEASMRYFYRSNRFVDPAGLAVLPAQHALDAGASIRLAHPDIAISGSLNNLLNQQKLDVLGQPLPGRSYHVSAQYWW